MKNEWMIDVLADLGQFARANGLKITAEQLEETLLLASLEIGSRKEAAKTDVSARKSTKGLSVSDGSVFQKSEACLH